MTTWIKANNEIARDFIFKNFKEAMGFINKVAELAEERNHHPDIFLHDYKKVRLTLSTHSESKVTEKDYQLADAIDKI